MKVKPKLAISDYFSEIKDPRVERTKEHKLMDILIIAICAVICGADSWVSIENYGKSKYKWLKMFLSLKNGIPSHDTFSRVFARLEPQEFQQCFLKWIQSIQKITVGEIVAIDGKKLRHSYKKGDPKGAIHMVNAWATEQRLVLGQRKINNKSNEITAIPELIKVLELTGCIVTIDAMGCQKNIVKIIADKNADYLITVKKNQPSLYDKISELFKEAIGKKFEGFTSSCYSTQEFSHGREESRHYLMLSNIRERIDPDQKWEKLQSVLMVESVRNVNGKTTVDTRYYISSLTKNAQQLGEAVRNHWGIENSLHWVLDVAFKEDDCRIRKDNAPQNFAGLRHLAINLLNQERTANMGIKNKRLKAGWDNDYLEKVLSVSN